MLFQRIKKAGSSLVAANVQTPTGLAEMADAGCNAIWACCSVQAWDLMQFIPSSNMQATVAAADTVNHGMGSLQHIIDRPEEWLC